MREKRQVWKGLFRLIREQFWPFLLFWLAIFLIRLHRFGGLLSLAFVNAEWAVQFWVKSGYSFTTAFLFCTLCGNIDLAMWFWFFKKGRFLLEHMYPKAGQWFINRFDPRQYDFSSNDIHIIRFLKKVALKLTEIFHKHQNLGLFLMGATPFCGIILGVPAAVGYKIKGGYWFMAIGNTLKIVMLGFVLTQKLVLLGLILFILFFALMSKKMKK